MKVITMAGAFMALIARPGIAQEPGAFLGREVASSTGAGTSSLPLSLSAEVDRREHRGSTFSIGPSAGYLEARGADRGTWFAGVQARLHALRFLAAEASITFHQNEYGNGDIVVTQYPVQVTGFLYPFPEGEVRPYLLAGAGWYYTRVRYEGALTLLYRDQTDHTFGGHAGAGLELQIGPSASIDADLRYIFLNPEADAVRSRDFDYWQFTAGLNLFF